MLHRKLLGKQIVRELHSRLAAIIVGWAITIAGFVFGLAENWWKAKGQGPSIPETPESILDSSAIRMPERSKIGVQFPRTIRCRNSVMQKSSFSPYKGDWKTKTPGSVWLELSVQLHMRRKSKSSLGFLKKSTAFRTVSSYRGRRNSEKPRIFAIGWSMSGELYFLIGNFFQW